MGAGGVSATPTDDELIERVRTGDRAAFAELYERHQPAARRYARAHSASDADADDIVAEAFAGVLGAVENGHGPVDGFVPYLMVAVRNECARTTRRRSRELPSEAPGDDRAAPAALLDEAGIVHAAFESLTPKYRDLLWRVEVEDEPYDEVARRYRISPRAVAMLTLRARRALATAYLARHLAADGAAEPLDRSCRAARNDLVHLVRGTAKGRRRRQLEAHVATCERCRRASDDLDRVNARLRSLPVAPIAAAGVAASTGLMGTIKGQLATWWSVIGTTAATSGAVALTVMSPVVLSHDAPRATAPNEAPAEPASTPGTSTEPEAPGGSAPEATTDPRASTPTSAGPSTSTPTTTTTAGSTTTTAGSTTTAPAQQGAPTTTVGGAAPPRPRDTRPTVGPTTVPVPTVPTVPSIPSVPDVPDVPDVPETPEVPEPPDVTLSVTVPPITAP